MQDSNLQPEAFWIHLEFDFRDLTTSSFSTSSTSTLSFNNWKTTEMQIPMRRIGGSISKPVTSEVSPRKPSTFPIDFLSWLVIRYEESCSWIREHALLGHTCNVIQVFLRLGSPSEFVGPAVTLITGSIQEGEKVFTHPTPLNKHIQTNALRC